MHLDLGTLDARAAAHLPEGVFAYAAAGSYDERTAAGNVAAWEQLWLRPRVLRDVSHVDTGAIVLGGRISCPVVVAQTAMHTMFWPDGEVATARAAAAFGTVMVVSMASTTSVEEIAATVPDVRLWMHVTVLADRARTRDLCRRAAEAGCEAVVLTVDCPVASRRPRAERADVPFPMPAELPNLVGPDDVADAADLLAAVGTFDRAVTFDDIAAVAEWSGGLPVVVKGVVRGDDARRCIDAGAAAVVVSNHGGRQLDLCVPTALVLAEVVDAVDGRGEVHVDGGIRRGVHVLQALALGATAVWSGRPLVYGLALDGSAGVTAVLQAFRDELEVAMALCGVAEVEQIDRDLIWQPDHDRRPRRAPMEER
jgi:4-hydroxymandelate oxidase